MADIKFWLGMLHRAALKRNDKLMVGNIDTTEPNYIDIAELLSVLTTDDLPESTTKKFVTPQEKQKLAEIAEGLLTATAAAELFYPKDTNPANYLTSASALASAKLTGLIAAELIPGLNADKITEGILAAARIPDLPASKITSGTFHVDRIPTLSPEKIDGLSIELGKYILASSMGKAGGPVQLDANIKVPVGNIPGLDANKITSGIFAEERIPNVFLKVSQLVNDLDSEATNVPAAANAVRLLKEYVDNLLSGLKLKADALCATTGNIQLQGEQVIDGKQTDISRVVVRAQDNPAQNGIYLTDPAGWTRTEDANTVEELNASTILVAEGDTFKGKKFLCSVTGELEVDPVSFKEVLEPNYVQKVNNIEPGPDGNVNISVGGSTSPTELISLSIGWQSGLTFKPLGEWKENGILLSDTRQIDASPGDVTYDRIDKFAIDLTLDRVILLEGVPSANPTEPEIDPLTQLEGPIILIKAGAATPDGVAGNVIWDEGGAGNWANTNAGPDFNLQSDTSPKSGNYAIEVVGLLTNGQSLPFIAPAPVAIENFKEPQFSIKNKTPGTFQILIGGNKANGRPSNVWIDPPATFDPDNVDTYQDVSIVMPYVDMVEVTKMSIVCRVEGWQYHIDDVRYVSGTETVVVGVTKEFVLAEDQKIQDQVDDNKNRISTLEAAVGGTAPVAYPTMADLYAAQANQVVNGSYRVDDASAHPDVQAGRAWFDFKGANFGDDRDYILRSEEESLNLDAQLTAIENRLTALEGEEILNAPAVAGKMPRTLANGSIEWVDEPTGGTGSDVQKIIEVKTNRLFTNNDHGAILVITASNVNLTWNPSGLRNDFSCELDCITGGDVSILGSEIDDPKGRKLWQEKIGTVYRRPDNGYLRLKGDFVTV